MLSSPNHFLILAIMFMESMLRLLRRFAYLNGARYRFEPLHDSFQFLKPVALAIDGERVSRSDHDS